MAEERFVGYFRLVEACAEPGCPVCWCVIRESRSHLGALPRTREKWRQLRDELGSFVAKHDYRDRQPFTAAEAAASTRAFGTLAGAKSVFDNDVHPRPRCPGP